MGFYAVLPLMMLFTGCQATFFFDLMKNFEQNNVGSTLPSDATLVDGPTGGKAISYGVGAKPIVATGGTPAYLIYALSHSKDLTYYTWFRMSKKLVDGDKFTLFALQGIKDNVLPVYFSVGMAATTSTIQGNEDDGIKQGELRQYLFVQQYTSYDRTSKFNNFVLKKPFESDKWYQLMIRIQIGKEPVVKPSKRKRRNLNGGERAFVQVRIDCNPVGEFELQDGAFEKTLLPYGYAVFGSEVKLSGKALTAINRFPGAMTRSQIINGAKAFNYYSPCDADFSLQEIPSEPLPSEYSDKKLNLYLELTKDVKPISLTCSGDKETRYNGESWDEGNFAYKCNNGVISETWIGRTCTDPVTKVVHRHNAKWINPGKECTEYKCELRRVQIRATDITCTAPVCSDGFAPIKVNGVCCPKCASDTCSAQKKYYKGCKRTCDDGPEFICPTKDEGCWCPEGQVENDKGECVQLRTCPCKAGNKIYKPGQTAVRSSCSTCVCFNGAMFCFERC